MRAFTQLKSSSPSRVCQPTELGQSSLVMACLLTTKPPSLLSLISSTRRHKLSIITPLHHSPTQIQQKEELPFIAQYLISSFGFSEDRALKLSSNNHLSPIKTPDRPDSVVQFLKKNGLTDTDIKSVVSWNPQLLSTYVDRTLEPRANELVTSGFSGNLFIELIKNNPSALNRNATLSTLQFWSNFVKNSEKALIGIIKKNHDLFNMDIDKHILPRMNLLHEYGLSDRQICILVTETSIILRNLDNLKLLLEKTVNLGFKQGSRMFVHGLIMVGSLKEDTIERKMEFFKNNYNWSDKEVKWAINKCPYILKFSEENVKSTMDFLITKFGFDAKSLALQPSIITYSLKRRLIPRDYVINMLKSNGVDVNYGAGSVIILSEEKFVEKFIVPYKEELPELWDSYLALRGGKMKN